AHSENAVSSRKGSAQSEYVESRKGSAHSEYVESRKGSAHSEYVESRKASAHSENAVSSRKGSAYLEIAESRKVSAQTENAKSKKGSAYSGKSESRKCSAHSEITQSKDGSALSENTESREAFVKRRIGSPHSESIAHSKDVESRNDSVHSEISVSETGFAQLENAGIKNGSTYSENVETRKSSAHSENAINRKCSALPENGESRKGSASLENAESRISSAHLEKIASRKGSTHSENAGSTFRKDSVNSENTEIRKSSVQTEIAESRKGTAHLENAISRKDCNSGNAESRKGSALPDNAESRKGSAHSENAEIRKGSAHLENVESRKGSTQSENAESRKGSTLSGINESRKGSMDSQDAGSRKNVGRSDNASENDATTAITDRQQPEVVPTEGTIRADPNFNAERCCEEVKEAIGKWNTDEESLIKILSGMNNGQRQQIQQIFKQTHEKELVDEIKEQLGGAFDEIVLGLLMSPREFDAHCLHQSMVKLGTDEAVINGIVATRSTEELQEIMKKYKEKYSRHLMHDIQGDTSADYLELLRIIVQAERDPGSRVDWAEAAEDAKCMFLCSMTDSDGGLTPSDERFRHVLSKKNRQQIRATIEEYERLINNDIETCIRSAMLTGDGEDALVALVQAIEDPVAFFSDRLQNAMSGFGTDDNTLIRIIVSRSEIDLTQIKSKYEKDFKRTLEEDIQSETRGDFKKMLLAIVKGN
ncbi:unnamed protein product, partial [Owenia fusiformis]